MFARLAGSEHHGLAIPRASEVHAMRKFPVVTLVLLAGFAVGACVCAQSVPPATTTAPQSSQTAATTRHHVPKPGDRNCVHDTGSLIPARKGECLPVNGRSYSGDELKRTGTNDTGRALQMLDPSISVGH
jgi:hypothetical protein